MDVVYLLGEATAADVCERLPEGPTRDTVRVTLAMLEKKGFVKHRREHNRNVYSPTVPASRARRSAMQHLLKTFYADSHSRAILTLLDLTSTRLSEEELDEIAEWIDRARKEKK